MLLNNMLTSLNPGQRMFIKEIQADEGTRQRLNAMGLLCGREIQVIRRARFGGPLQVRVGSVNLILRRREAEYVKVASAV